LHQYAEKHTESIDCVNKTKKRSITAFVGDSFMFQYLISPTYLLYLLILLAVV